MFPSFCVWFINCISMVNPQVYLVLYRHIVCRLYNTFEIKVVCIYFPFISILVVHNQDITNWHGVQEHMPQLTLSGLATRN